MSRTIVCAWLAACALVGSVGAASAGLKFEVVWQAKGNGGFSAPNALRDRSGKCIGIVVGESKVGVACFDLKGVRLWTYPMSPPVAAAPAVADLNGDGAEEIAADDGAGNLVILDAGGKPLWTARLPGPVRADSCPAIADLFGDDKREVLVGDTAGYVSCFDASGKLLWRFQGEGTQMGPMLIADIYDLPGREIVVTSHDNHIYALSASGARLWDIFTPNDLFPNSTPLLADVDGDGVPELYIPGGLHHFYRIDLAKAAIAFEQNVYMHINTAIAASDIDGDGRDEVIFGTKGGGVWCYGSGGFRWKRELHASFLYAAPTLIPIDATRSLAALFYSSAGDVQVFAADGTHLYSAQTPGRPAVAPLVGDLDGNGQAEIVATTYGDTAGDAALLFARLGVPYRDDPRNRTVFGGDRAHTGLPERHATYRTLPAPSASTAAAAGASAAPFDENPVLSGPNTWRYDVLNPGGKRLAFELDLRYPDGSVRRFVRHVRGERERVAMTVVAAEPGRYEVAERLMDADSRAVLASRSRTIDFRGTADDESHLRAVIAGTTSDAVAWQATNPECADGVSRQLAALEGSIDSLARVPDPERAALTASLRQSADRLRAIAKAGRSLAPKSSIVVWRYNPWAYFDPLATLPVPEDNAEHVRIAMCRGEYKAIALNMTNVSGSALDVRVSVGPWTGARNDGGSGRIELRQAVTVPVIDRDRFADALPKLAEGGLLTIPPYETRQLWVTVHAQGVRAGDYVAPIALKTVATQASHLTVPLGITVHDVELPRKHPLRFNVWVTDGGPLGADRPSVLRDLVDHCVTVYLGPAPTASCAADGRLAGPLDFGKHDEAMRRLSPHGFMLFMSPQSAVTGAAEFSPAWRKAFVAYMRAWVAHMKRLRVGYDRWAVYPYDEPSSPYSQTTLDLVKVAKLVREADPRITIYADPTSGTTMETVRMFSGLIDIWQPSSELLERLGPELLPVAHRVGKEVWMYDAAGNAKTLSCLGIYRWRFWYAWKLGLKGIGWWVYAANSGIDRWDQSPEGDFFASVYDGPDGPIPSKRWEAAREGIQDYEYLWMLRGAIRDAEARHAPAAVVAAARNALDETPREVEAVLARVGRRPPLNADGVPRYEEATRAVDEAREKIVRAYLSLRKR